MIGKWDSLNPTTGPLDKEEDELVARLRASREVCDIHLEDEISQARRDVQTLTGLDRAFRASRVFENASTAPSNESACVGIESRPKDPIGSPRMDHGGDGSMCRTVEVGQNTGASLVRVKKEARVVSDDTIAVRGCQAAPCQQRDIEMWAADGIRRRRLARRRGHVRIQCRRRGTPNGAEQRRPVKAAQSIRENILRAG